MAVVLNVVSMFNDKGLKSATDELDKFSKATHEQIGKTSKAMGAVGFGILAGAGAVGVGLYQIGSSFDEAFDAIRTGTGATGPVLDQLKNDMKAVASAVPASFADAGTAITGFNQKLGLTGQPLQLLSEQALELSRITGTELAGNVESITNVMQNFGVSAGDQSGKLDLLFRASQQSGVSVADLSAQMSDAGVVLRSVGLDFDQSAAFLATLGKAGIDTGDVMPALSKALAVAAKDGKDATTVFNETFDAIKNAPTDVDAAGVALETFGAKAGPKFAAMIREGKLSYQDMLAGLQGGGDTILGAGKDTQDFGEKLTLLKNRVFVALEPVATKVFNAIGDAMDRLGPIVENLTKWMMDHKGVMIVVAGVIGGIAVIAITAYAIAMAAAAIATITAAAPILLIVALIALLVAGVIYAYKNFGWFRDAVAVAWQVIQTVVKFAWENVIKPIFNIIMIYLKLSIAFYMMLWEAVKFVFGMIMDAILFAWNSVIKPVWNLIMVGIDLVIWYYKMLWEIVKFVFEMIVSAIQTAWGFISGVFDSIKNGIQTVWEFFQTSKDIIGNVFNNIADAISGPFKTAFNFIADAWNNTVGSLSWSVPDWVPVIGGKTISVPKLPHFANGGMFNTAMGGGAGLAVLHDNEMILNPQQQKALFSGNGVGGGENSYTINVTVAATADKAAIGQTIVEAIASFEKRSGTSWRAA
jgi:TP901 family phage tail tape measure protein